MILKEIWDYCVWETIPIISLSSILLLPQMMFGAVLPILTLVRIVKRKSKLEIFAFCLVPIVLIVAMAIVEPLFFGSFVDAGFSSDDMAHLKKLIFQRRFFVESMGVAGMFLFCSIFFLLLDHFVSGSSVLKSIANMGIEYLFVVEIGAVCYDYFQNGGERFFALNEVLIKWYIYGLYLLLSKSVFYLICLLFYLMFREKAKLYEFGQFASPEDWIKNYFSKSYGRLGIAFLLFAAFWFGIAAVPVLKEKASGTGVIIIGINILFAAAGIWCVLCVLFPKLVPNYRRILKWGYKEQITRLLYQELEVEKPLRKLLLDVGIVTKHFVVLYFPCRIYYLPLYEKREEVSENSDKLYFKDGSHFRINEQDGAFIVGRTMRL